MKKLVIILVVLLFWSCTKEDNDPLVTTSEELPASELLKSAIDDETKEDCLTRIYLAQHDKIFHYRDKIRSSSCVDTILIYRDSIDIVGYCHNILFNELYGHEEFLVE